MRRSPTMPAPATALICTGPNQTCALLGDLGDPCEIHINCKSWNCDVSGHCAPAVQEVACDY